MTRSRLLALGAAVLGVLFIEGTHAHCQELRHFEEHSRPEPMSRWTAYAPLLALHAADEGLTRTMERRGRLEANPALRWASPRERLLVRAGSTVALAEGARWLSGRSRFGKIAAFVALGSVEAGLAGAVGFHLSIAF